MLLVSQLSFAESLKERKVKQEMLDRVDTLTTKLQEGENALDKEDVLAACKNIDEAFKIMPDHLVGIGTKMDLFNSKVIKMEKESKMHLIYLHTASNTCSREETGINLDIEETQKKLKSMRKALVKQRKKIKKLDTGFANTYNYYYEFN
jgi:predicted RNase H-like nuclease (RuvC/YqgF family)